jgi:hypothetical protein
VLLVPALDGFLHKIVSPTAGKSEPFPRIWAFLYSFFKSVKLQSVDTLVSFDVSLFTNVPINALHLVSNKLHKSDTLVKWSALQAIAIVELQEV